jgi:hypothetical protein
MELYRKVLCKDRLPDDEQSVLILLNGRFYAHGGKHTCEVLLKSEARHTDLEYSWLEPFTPPSVSEMMEAMTNTDAGQYIISFEHEARELAEAIYKLIMGVGEL